MGIAAATTPNGSRPQEAMFRQLIETVVVAPLRSRDRPAGRGRETGAGFMLNFTPIVSDLATDRPEKSFSEVPNELIDRRMGTGE
jgi:hypothetical protein